jgi:GT2 family glycosyltransferase
MTPAHAAVDVIGVLTAMLALGWLWQAVAALRGIPTLPDLTSPGTEWPPLIPAEGPDVTVIVPACNEEESITATLHSLLASTAVRLQIVAVDDRSTDGTAARMDRVAAEALAADCPHTLEVIHNCELPAGWLGKTHALALAARRAHAPWLLFTDGDVRFDPRAIELALRYARAEGADHVLLTLTLDLDGVAEAAVYGAFHAMAGWNMRLWKVADPAARDFLGTGGFGMVRREVYDRVGGFEQLRMEVLEDMRLGWKIKRAGFAQRVALGAGLVRIRWIDGALGIVGLLEKNGFAVARFRLEVALFAMAAMALQILLPLAALAVGGWAAVAGLLTYAFTGLAYFAMRRVSHVSPLLALLFAPATGILCFALARSVALALWRGGIVWRGTRYPLDELRRNAERGW